MRKILSIAVMGVFASPTTTVAPCSAITIEPASPLTAIPLGPAATPRWAMAPSPCNATPLASAKAAMVAGGVIASDVCRHPIAPLHPQARETLLELLRPLDPVVLRWGK